MKTPAEILAPLDVLSDDELVVWIMGLAQEHPLNPEFPYPRDYRAAVDFLVAVLYQLNDQGISVRFGNASGKAFHHFLSSGGYVPKAVKKDKGEVASNLLYLVEALPSDPVQARELVETLMSMLCSPALKAFPNSEIDLHKRLLMALPVKLDVAHCYESDVPVRLRYDLHHRDYAADAFATIIRLSPTNIGEDLKTVLKTLQENNRPTTQLFSDLILAIAKHPIDTGAIFAALADAATDRAKQEFREELAAFSRSDLLEVWDRTFPQNAPSLIHGANTAVAEMAQRIEWFLATELKKPVLASANDTQALETTFGTRIAGLLLDEWEAGGNCSSELLNCRRLEAIVQALDNGIWSGRNTFSNTVEFPSWFDQDGRRKFAARSVRQCVRFVAFAGKWKMDINEFKQRIEELNLDHYLAEIAALLPTEPSERKKLRLTVSPFPEDQLFFLVLQTAGNLRSRVVFEARPAPWADRNSLDADCSLINELALANTVRRETDSSHNIFRHEGYFVFANSPGPSTVDDRIKFALDKEFRRYNRGEYPEIATAFEKKLNAGIKNSVQAPPWPQDFESFIVGRDQVYVGGSINARLLLRLWQNTGRIFPVCTQNDFRTVLGGMPSNRLVLGPEFRKRLGTRKIRILVPKLVELYKEVGKFLHNSACAAIKHDPRGQKIIRHFMHILAEGTNQYEDGFWNFVVSEQDMCSLLLDDNKFVLEEADSLASTLVPATK